MFKFLKIKLLLIIFFSLLLNAQFSSAADFNTELREIRSEINRDNLQEAIKKLKKITISNDFEQEKIDLLFGDIYLKINQISKAEEYYQKNFFTSNEEIESLTYIGLAEIRLAQGKLDDAINYAKKSIKINSNKIRPKIILAIAKTRLGESQEGFDILNELYLNRKDAEVALAISNYFSSFDETKKAIEILEEFIKRKPNNIKVLNQLASLHLIDGNKEKAIEYKMIVFKYHEFNRNRKKQKQAKAWILSVDPKYFDKPVRVRKNEKKEQEEYQEEEISNYDDNTIKPNYEDIGFANNGHGSGFILGDGKYVITNEHVINGAKRIAVRNGLGKVSNAKVLASSKDFDVAVLELEKPYSKEHSLSPSDFYDGKPGDEIIALGFPITGEDIFQPSITEGIITKTFSDDYPVFQISAIINKGNSGGPVFNEKGQLAGIIFAGTNTALIMEKYGFVPTAVGMGIKSKVISKLLNYENNNVPTKKVSFSKSKLYEKVLGTVVLVAVQIDE